MMTTKDKLEDKPEDEPPHDEDFRMSQDDWLDAWNNGELLWHFNRVEPSLITHLDKLTGGSDYTTILVPMCGKSTDMHWLADKGYFVVGIELSETAAQQFFVDHKLDYNMYITDRGIIYESFSKCFHIVVTDFFMFDKEVFGTFDCILDVNSFGSVNEEDRQRYANHCHSLLNSNGRVLLSTLMMDDNEIKSITTKKLKTICDTKFDVEKLQTLDVTEETLQNFDKYRWKWKPCKVEKHIHLLKRTQ